MDQRRNRIEHEVEQTLAAFHRTEPLKASPWFAARVRARLTGSSSPQASLGWFGLLRLGPALLGLIVLLNVATAVVAFQKSGHDAAVRQTYVQSFAWEYAYTTTDMLFELTEP